MARQEIKRSDAGDDCDRLLLQTASACRDAGLRRQCTDADHVDLARIVRHWSEMPTSSQRAILQLLDRAVAREDDA